MPVAQLDRATASKPWVEGSNLPGAPFGINNNSSLSNGGCSSVGRALDCDSGCREFKSPVAPSYFSYRRLAQLGSALGLGPRGRRFKSCNADHLNSVFRRLAQLGSALGLVQGSQVQILQRRPLLNFSFLSHFSKSLTQ